MKPFPPSIVPPAIEVVNSIAEVLQPPVEQQRPAPAEKSANATLERKAQVNVDIDVESFTDPEAAAVEKARLEHLETKRRRLQQQQEEVEQQKTKTKPKSQEQESPTISAAVSVSSSSASSSTPRQQVSPAKIAVESPPAADISLELSTNSHGGATVEANSDASNAEEAQAVSPRGPVEPLVVAISPERRSEAAVASPSSRATHLPPSPEQRAMQQQLDEAQPTNASVPVSIAVAEEELLREEVAAVGDDETPADAAAEPTEWGNDSTLVVEEVADGGAPAQGDTADQIATDSTGNLVAAAPVFTLADMKQEFSSIADTVNAEEDEQQQ